MTLARDFHREGTWAFSFRQTMDTSGDMPKMEIAGEMTITSNRDGTANVEIAISTPQGAPAMKFPLAEKPASFKFERPEAVLELLFPLPSKPLRPNEVDKVTVVMPKKPEGTVDVPYEMTYLKTDKVGDLPCAMLDTKLETPASEADVAIKLHGHSCVDLRDGLPRKVDIDGSVTTSYAGSSMSMKAKFELVRK